MIIKVCGMRNSDNIANLSQLPINMIGFILYDKSPRFAPTPTAPTPNIDRVGVFVNATLDDILGYVKSHNLNCVQLHGGESPQLCADLKSKNLKVIKAISVAEPEDFDNGNIYNGVVDYLLFDTKTPKYGGSGVSFNWNYLSHYSGKTPFLLSGGITLDSASDIKQIEHPMFAGVDLNSGFELSPAEKDIDKIKNFIKQIKQ